MMATNRISVLIDVAADRANRSLTTFRKSVKDADGAVGKFKAGSSAAFGAIKANAGNLALAGGAALVTFGAKAVSSFTDAAIAAGQFADATGLSNEEASKWISVADDYGLSADTLQRAFLRLNKELGEGSDLADQYGLSIQHTADGQVDTNATMMEAIRIIGGIQDPTKRAAAAQELFGRSYAEVAEIILGDADKITAALESTSDAQIFDDDEVRKAREYRAVMDELNDTVTDFTMVVGEALTPAVVDATEALVDYKNVAQDLGSLIPGPVKTGFKLLGDQVQRSLLWPKYIADVKDVFVDTAEESAKGANTLKEALDGTTHAGQWVTEALGDTATSAVELAEAEAEAEEAAAAHKAQIEANVAALESLKDAQDEAREATEAAHEAVLEAIDSSLGYRNQTARTAEAIAASNEELGKGENAQQEYEQAQRDAEAAVLDQAAAAAQLASDQATANGEMLTAQQKTDRYVEELEALVGELDGPAAFAIAMHIERLKAIPRSIDTSLTFSGGSSFTGGKNWQGAGQDLVKGATGGIVTKPTMALIGEAGPEAVIPLNRTPGSSPLPSGGMGGPTYITVNNYSADPEQVVNAIKKYARRNGPGSLPQ